MTRLKCTVSYVGKGYDGWQSQKNGKSIQEHLESIISSIENREVHIIGSGRTDAGVSARAQVFCFNTERDMSERKWMGAINAFLPDDIHIMRVEKVPDTFHARYCVRWKKYTYRINDGPYDVQRFLSGHMISLPTIPVRCLFIRIRRVQSFPFMWKKKKI